MDGGVPKQAELGPATGAGVPAPLPRKLFAPGVGTDGGHGAWGRTGKTTSIGVKMYSPSTWGSPADLPSEVRSICSGPGSAGKENERGMAAAAATLFLEESCSG